MVESGPLPEGTVRLPAEVIEEFIYTIFRNKDMPEDDARLVAKVLVNADLRGIRSHGAARLTFFMVRLENGVLNSRPDMKFYQGSDTTGLLDADDAIGIVASNRAMDEALTMAEKHGSGFVTVRNSSHFGYAGYWAKKAMEAGYIGISMTNGGRRTAPTFGAEAIFGTNPMSVAIPGGPGGTDFHLDMATAVTAVGKIETALREGREVPKGWVLSSMGTPTLNDKSILNYEVPLAPLGGEGDENGGHKGYGLQLMVELLCGVLSGAGIEGRMAGATGMAKSATGHFMGAIKVSGFRDLSTIFGDMGKLFDTIRGVKKTPGHDYIYIHGEPEAVAEEENKRIGVPITPAVLKQIQRLNEELKLGFEL